MPDLGRYAAEVLSSYAVSLALIAALVGLTLRRGAKVRRALDEMEARQGQSQGQAAAAPVPAPERERGHG